MSERLVCIHLLFLQVIETANFEADDAEKASVAVKAFMMADLPNQLTELCQGNQPWLKIGKCTVHGVLQYNGHRKYVVWDYYHCNSDWTSLLMAPLNSSHYQRTIFEISLDLFAANRHYRTDHSGSSDEGVYNM